MVSTLKFELVKEMVANYRSNQLRSILESATNPMQDDAHSIWFDFETLKKFMADIETLAAGNPATASRKLGIRCYYAAYPEISKWDTDGYQDLAPLLNDHLTKRYEKKHTLVLIPTNEVDGFNVDFNPLDNNNYSKPAGMTAGILTALTSGSTTVGLNHGALIPPKSSFGEWF